MMNLNCRSARSLLGLCLAAAVPAQDADQQKKLVESRDHKLKSGFLRESRWFTDFEKAKVAAKLDEKSILIYFTRSYAPSPACDEVEKTILSDPKFAAVTDKLALFCHVTSRVDSDPDQDLLPRMGGESFPFVVVTDYTGKQIASLGRLSSLADIRGMLDGEVAAFHALRVRAAKGDKAAKAKFFLARLQLGHLTPKEIETELSRAEYLTPEQQQQIRRSLAILEVMEILASIDEKNPKSRKAAAERMLVMMRAGRIPSDRSAFVFWQVLLAHADQTEDADLFETSLRSLKKLPGGRLDPKWLRKMELKLRALKFMNSRKKTGK